MATESDRSGWARSGEVTIAYRTLGAGPLDLVFLSGFISHIEVLLDEPGLQRWFRRLGRLGRVIVVDRRGSGLSDALRPGHTVDDDVRDLEAVLDAAGSERAVIMAYAAGGPLALTFAAQRPERVLALVLYAAMVQTVPDEHVTWTTSPEEREERLVASLTTWGTGGNLDLMAPNAAGDERMRAWLGRLERLSMTPTALRRMTEAMATVTTVPLLPSIRVPTLVLHRTDDRMIDVRHSRLLARRIPGARLVELPGEDSLPMVGDMTALLDEIEEFLTGGRRGAEPERELLTVLFTDICDATATAARLGDKEWADLLGAHQDAVRRELARYDGREVKTVGDGFLATFRSPSAALRCAQAAVAATGRLGVELRAGLHTGECELMGDDVGGMAVHIAARVGALAGPGEVWASGTVYGTVVGSGIRFEDLGSHALKGVPGHWPLFRLAAE